MTLPKDWTSPAVRTFWLIAHMIFVRLPIGHLYETWDPADTDLVITNPPNPGRNHTMLVIGHAATYDTADGWPFDDTDDPAIIKATDTAQSAGKGLPGKQKVAPEHGNANAPVLRHPDPIDGSRVIVYGDIRTTGLQLNAVAQRLRNWGAVSVDGVALARPGAKATSDRRSVRPRGELRAGLAALDVR